MALKLKSKGYHKYYKGGYRVEFAISGFRYNGGLFSTKKEADSKVKEMLIEIETGKLQPSYLQSRKTSSTEERKSLLEAIRTANGNLSRRNSKEPVKSEEVIKKTKDRLSKAKELKFQPDTDPDVEPEINKTVEPKRDKPLPIIEGLEILNNLSKIERDYKTLNVNLSAEREYVDKEEVQKMIDAAVAKAVAETVRGIQGNKKPRRSV